MNLIQAIKKAELLLPGKSCPENEDDPRWKAIIKIGNFIKTNPEEIWLFVEKWGTNKNEDLRTAISTCILEHLLEYHFELIFPRVENLAKRNRYFADTFTMCWKFGKTCEDKNSEQFDKLKKYLLKKSKK